MGVEGGVGGGCGASDCARTNLAHKRMPEKNKTYVGNVITARAKVAPSVQEWVDGRRTWDENDMCPQERLQKAEQRLPAQYSPTSVLPLKRKALNNSSEIKSPTSLTVGRDDPGKGTPP